MKKEEFFNKMKEYENEIDIVFDEEQLGMLYQYMILLLEWNEKINLTAIIEPSEIIIKHFIDSMTILKYIDENKTLVDIGTGAGFPGIVLKIVRPDIKITLVDSLNKRILFLDDVIQKLNLKNIETIHSRIEDFGRNKKYREKYDVVTSRAVANLSTLAEYMIPLIKIKGIGIAMKGNEVQEEIKVSQKAIQILGAKINKIESFNLPKSDMGRNIILIDKQTKTPNQYPRKPGTPSKEPIS